MDGFLNGVVDDTFCGIIDAVSMRTVVVSMTKTAKLIQGIPIY